MHSEVVFCLSKDTAVLSLQKKIVNFFSKCFILHERIFIKYFFEISCIQTYENILHTQRISKIMFLGVCKLKTLNENCVFDKICS